MSPDELAAQEAKADRFLKRGDFLRALAVLKGIVAEHPERKDLAERAKLIAESLHPSELQQMSAPAPSEVDLSPASSPEEEGERLFQKGDYAGAAAAYRRAFEMKPSSELIRERLVELFQLAQAQHGGKSRPAAAPMPPAPSRPTAVLSVAPVAPRVSAAPARVPVSPEERLRALLSRIAERRRA